MRILLAGALVHLASAIAGAQPTGRYAVQLSAECQSLVRGAVRRPYGLGFDPVDGAGQQARNLPRAISMDPLNTPAAGLVLLKASQLLNDDDLRKAAYETARGVVASQVSTGQVISPTIFGAAANGRAEPSMVADRAPTRCGLALLLAVIEDARGRDEKDYPGKLELYTSAATRAANWLAKQGAGNHLWPSAYPPEAAPRDSVRLVLLDTPDYRDSTLALFLAGEVLEDKKLTDLAVKSTEQLSRLALSDPARWRGLWSAAYTPDGAATDHGESLKLRADVLASRFAMQTLLCGYLLTGERAYGKTLDAAAAALSTLKRPDGLWDRYPAIVAPSERREGVDASRPAMEGLWQTARFGLAETIESINQLKVLGRDRYLDMMKSNYTAREGLALTLAGLSDQPLGADLPVTAADAARHQEQKAAEWDLVNGDVPKDLPGKVRRLGVLLLGTKLERRAS